MRINKKGSLIPFLRLLRLHQWSKNTLLFIPFLAAHQVNDLSSFMKLLLAFLAFSFCASSVYIINDMFDIEHDRRHPRKRYRPLASGVVSVQQSVYLAILLLLAALYLSWHINVAFQVSLALYFAVSYSYSLLLKKFAVLDCFILAFLYTLRIIAGGVAVSLFPSVWLLTFSLFIFLSLAFMKRYGEFILKSTLERNDKQGRGYEIGDELGTLIFGVASSFTSPLVLALYLDSESVKVLYEKPELIWIVVPTLLFWSCRMWLLTLRGRLDDDPVMFTLKDPLSLFLLLLWCTVFILAASRV